MVSDWVLLNLTSCYWVFGVDRVYVWMIEMLGILFSWIWCRNCMKVLLFRVFKQIWSIKRLNFNTIEWCIFEWKQKLFFYLDLGIFFEMLEIFVLYLELKLYRIGNILFWINGIWGLSPATWIWILKVLQWCIMCNFPYIAWALVLDKLDSIRTAFLCHLSIH